MPSDAAPRPVTIILPHRERFGTEGAGAVAMVVRRLAAGPSRYEALVVGPEFDGARFEAIAFQAVRLTRLLPLTQQYTIGVARALARLPPGPIEVHNKPDLAHRLALLFPRRPVSLFLHNDPSSMRGARSPAARRRLLARLARVATVSEFLRVCLLDGVAVPARPPVVLRNAIDPACVPTLPPYAERDRVILFAGRVVPDKAPDAFAQACAVALPRLPGWRAEIIGADGFSTDAAETGFIRRLRPIAAAAGVAMLGYRPHAEVLRAMTRAAIVVVPSRWPEPFGLTALEAMACGAALACSGRGGLAEVMGEAGVAIDPDDPGAMADILVRMAHDAPARAALSEAGRARARDHFAAADAAVALDALRDDARRFREHVIPAA